MAALDRDPMFVALTRPQLLFGVPYAFATINAVVTTELFLISGSAWVLLFAAIFHAMGAIVTISDPYKIDLWLAKVRKCPHVPNYRIWQCNSYRP